MTLYFAFIRDDRRIPIAAEFAGDRLVKVTDMETGAVLMEPQIAEAIARNLKVSTDRAA